MLERINPTTTQAWFVLKKHHEEEMSRKHMKDLFTADTDRFNKKINELRIRHKEFGLKVIKCMKFTDFRKNNIDCKFYLNKNKIRDIHKKLFKNWIKINKFE